MPALTNWNLLTTSSAFVAVVIAVGAFFITKELNWSLLQRYRTVLALLRLYMWIVAVTVFLVINFEYLPLIIEPIRNGETIIIFRRINGWHFSMSNFPYNAILQVSLGYVTVALLISAIRFLRTGQSIYKQNSDD